MAIIKEQLISLVKHEIERGRKEPPPKELTFKTRLVLSFRARHGIQSENKLIYSGSFLRSTGITSKYKCSLPSTQTMVF